MNEQRKRIDVFGYNQKCPWDGICWQILPSEISAGQFERLQLQLAPQLQSEKTNDWEWIDLQQRL